VEFVAIDVGTSYKKYIAKAELPELGFLNDPDSMGTKGSNESIYCKDPLAVIKFSCHFLWQKADRCQNALYKDQLK
jgi:hypothetical protein